MYCACIYLQKCNPPSENPGYGPGSVSNMIFLLIDKTISPAMVRPNCMLELVQY